RCRAFCFLESLRSQAACVSQASRRGRRSREGNRRVVFVGAAPSRRIDCKSAGSRSEEHTSELQSREKLVCRLPLEKKHHTRARHPYLVVSLQAPGTPGTSPLSLHDALPISDAGRFAFWSRSAHKPRA